MNETRLKLDHCPACKSECDSASSSDNSNAKPVPYDITVCFYCAETLQFDEDLRLTSLSSRDFDMLDKETRIEVLKVKRFVKEEIDRKEKNE